MFDNLKIRSKINILSVILVTILILISIYSYFELTKANNNLISIYEENVQAITIGSEIEKGAYENSNSIYSLLLSNSPGQSQEIINDIRNTYEVVNKNMETLKNLSQDENHQRLYNDVSVSINSLREVLLPIVDELENGNAEEAYTLFYKDEAAFNSLNKSIDALNSYNQELIEQVIVQNNINHTNNIKTLSLIVVLMLLFSGLAVFIISRSITRPLSKTIDSLNVIASGDLSKDIEEDFLNRQDEFGELINSANLMKNSMNNLVTNMILEARTVEELVNAVSSKILSLNEDIECVTTSTEELSAGMEETSASAEEMAATSQQMASGVQSLSQKAQDGSEKASNISDRASSTQSQVRKAESESNQIFAETRRDLETAIEASKVISQIDLLTESIMQITDQTNLLALNASIEAARAGDVGRGFTVVAQEIRELAEESQGTVAEIQNVTKDVSEAVNNLVTCSSNILDYMNVNVSKDYKTFLEVGDNYSEDGQFVERLVADFSMTSDEILSSIEDVLEAINSVTMASEQGAEGVTEIASRSSEVTRNSNEILELINKSKKESENLMKVVSNFKV